MGGAGLEPGGYVSPSSHGAVRRFRNDNDILQGGDWSEGISLINVYFSYLEHHLVQQQQQQQQHLICYKRGTSVVTLKSQRHHSANIYSLETESADTCRDITLKYYYYQFKVTFVCARQFCVHKVVVFFLKVMNVALMLVTCSRIQVLQNVGVALN